MSKAGGDSSSFAYSYNLSQRRVLTTELGSLFVTEVAVLDHFDAEIFFYDSVCALWSIK
jgi:hypothetical protein